MTSPTASVVALFIAPEPGAPVHEVREVLAVAGRGLEGDRHAGKPDGAREPDDDITLISIEGLERTRAEHGLALEPGEHRRNVVTRGIDLLACVGREIAVGEVPVLVTADNPPCRRLAKLTGKPVVEALLRDGGVRGRVLRGGTIRTGDHVRLA